MLKVLSKSDVRFKRHDPDSHKGDNGRLLIVAGSIDYVGCVALASLAAFRSGCDVVVAACPQKVAWAINSYDPNIITKKLEGDYLSSEHVPIILDLAKHCDALLIGNGLGVGAETNKAVKQIIHQIAIPAIVDADGIKAVSINDLKNSVITPHKKEFEIFCNNSDIPVPKNLKAIQPILKSNVLLLKGSDDFIVSDKEFFVNKTGYESMTKAGTGDVLAGFLAGLICQGYGLVKSACISAYFIGAAGEKISRSRGYSYTARELLDEIIVKV